MLLSDDKLPDDLGSPPDDRVLREVSAHSEIAENTPAPNAPAPDAEVNQGSEPELMETMKLEELRNLGRSP